MVNSLGLFLLVSIIGITAGIPTCPPIPVAGVYVCKRQGLTSVPVSTLLPFEIQRTLEALDLSGNLINVLHEDVLASFPRLRHLNLDDNRLWKITDTAFRLVPHLEELTLRHNLLALHSDSLSKECWTYAPNLKLLDLSDNPIYHLPDLFFAGLPNLVVLGLGNLTSAKTVPLTIDRHAFHGLTNLNRLSLIDNNLTHLPRYLTDSFNEMPDLTSLQLFNNRWQCGCSIEWLIDWLTVVNGTQQFADQDRWLSSAKFYPTNALRNHPPICYEPFNLRGRSLLDLGRRDLECKPRLAEEQLSSNVIYSHTNSKVSLNCNLYANPPIEIVRWQHNGTPVTPVSGSTEVEREVKGYNYHSTLTLAKVAPIQDEGVYTCEAGNRLGTASVHFELIVHGDNATSESGKTNRKEVADSRLLEMNTSMAWKLAVFGVIGTSLLVFIIMTSWCAYRLSGVRNFDKVRIIRWADDHGEASRPVGGYHDETDQALDTVPCYETRMFYTLHRGSQLHVLPRLEQYENWFKESGPDCTMTYSTDYFSSPTEFHSVKCGRASATCQGITLDPLMLPKMTNQSENWPSEERWG